MLEWRFWITAEQLADAAIAVSYVLGVTEPYGSGIGGGGGMLIVPESEDPNFIDYREHHRKTQVQNTMRVFLA